VQMDFLDWIYVHRIESKYLLSILSTVNRGQGINVNCSLYAFSESKRYERSENVLTLDH
jgi:hypothetical protein